MGKNTHTIVILLIAMMGVASCKQDPIESPQTKEIKPVSIEVEGIDLIEQMAGHWIGKNKVLSWEWDWFSFDYRPISASHVFGIFEGGSMGNLFTSFFVADFKGTQTIMARNGGVLSGIYRTSYFVLDQTRHDEDGNYYRLVDAVGGEDVMYMELRFKGDSLYFNAYTSRLGENDLPYRHMTFKAKRSSTVLADAVAEEVNFPQEVNTWDFSGGFREDYLYVIPDETEAKSASFLSQLPENDVFALANLSGDPFKIQDHPTISRLNIDFDHVPESNVLLYLSSQPLIDDDGTIQWTHFDSVLLFPELSAGTTSFEFTYLHPGDYYVTAFLDQDEDGIPSELDTFSASRSIEITPESYNEMQIDF